MKRLIGIVGKQGAMVCGLLLLLILLAAGRSLANRSDDGSDTDIENRARSLSELVGQPICTWIPALRYPPAVRDKSLAGRVLVSVFLDKDGRIIDTEVLDSDLPELFIVEALKAARLSRFKAKSVGGLPMHSSVVLPFRFDALEAPKAPWISSEEPQATQAGSEEPQATQAGSDEPQATRTIDEAPVTVAAATIPAETVATEPEPLRDTPQAASAATVPAERVDSPVVSPSDDQQETIRDLPVPAEEERVETPSVPTLDDAAVNDMAEDDTLTESDASLPPVPDDAAIDDVVPMEMTSTLTLDDDGFGKAVSNRILESRAEIFSEGERVFFWIAVSGGGGRSVIRHVWFHEGREIQSIELTLRGSPWHTWSYKTLFAGMAGDWRVDVLDSEGRLVGSRSFVCAKGESSD